MAMHAHPVPTDPYNPCQSLLSYLGICRLGTMCIPIRSDSSPHLCSRDLSKNDCVVCERAWSLHEAVLGNSPSDIFPRPRRRDKWENAGRRKRGGGRIANLFIDRPTPMPRSAAQAGLIQSRRGSRPQPSTAHIPHSYTPENAYTFTWNSFWGQPNNRGAIDSKYSILDINGRLLSIP